MLQGPSPIHQVRSPRLPLEPVQRRSHQSPILRQATAPYPAQLLLPVMVPTPAIEDHDRGASQAIPMA